MSLTSVCAVEKWWRMAYFWLRKGGPFSWSYANLRRRSRRIPREAGMGLLNILGGLGFQRPQPPPERLQLFLGYDAQQKEETSIRRARRRQCDACLKPPGQRKLRLEQGDDAHENRRCERGAQPGVPWRMDANKATQRCKAKSQPPQESQEQGERSAEHPVLRNEQQPRGEVDDAPCPYLLRREGGLPDAHEHGLKDSHVGDQHHGDSQDAQDGDARGVLLPEEDAEQLLREGDEDACERQGDDEGVAVEQGNPLPETVLPPFFPELRAHGEQHGANRVEHVPEELRHGEGRGEKGDLAERPEEGQERHGELAVEEVYRGCRWHQGDGEAEVFLHVFPADLDAGL